MAYSDGRQFLIFKAAQSYLESQYFDTARLLFKKIVRSGHDNEWRNFYICIPRPIIFTSKTCLHDHFNSLKEPKPWISIKVSVAYTWIR